jgi:hypothetical protein
MPITERDHWLEYFTRIHDIEDIKAGGTTEIMYALENRRAKAHAELEEYYSKRTPDTKMERLRIVCSNLEVCVGERLRGADGGDAEAMTHLMNCREMINFLEGKTTACHTRYGLLEAK